MDASDSLVNEVLPQETVAPDELAHVHQVVLNSTPSGTQLGDQIVDLAHDASLQIRDDGVDLLRAASSWRATISAISALSVVMSTASLVSSASTYDDDRDVVAVLR